MRVAIVRTMPIKDDRGEDGFFEMTVELDAVKLNASKAPRAHIEFVTDQVAKNLAEAHGLPLAMITIEYPEVIQKLTGLPPMLHCGDIT